MRFLRLPPRLQSVIAAGALLCLGWIGLVSFDYFTGDARLEAKKRELDYVSGELNALVGELERLQSQALGRAEQLEMRQRLLDRYLNAHETTPETIDEEPAFETEAATTIPQDRQTRHGAFRPAEQKSSFLAALIGAPSASAGGVSTVALFEDRTDRLLGKLQMIEKEQTRFAQQAAAYEKAQLAAARDTVERLGLAYAELVTMASGPGIGGPLLPVEDADLPPEFARLQELIDDRRLLAQAILSLPSRPPSDNYYISSRFGPRKDPFRRTWAHHSGIDMAGWPGEPILAAGGGIVVKAGRAAAYGLMVEIDHGHGLRTRYGHMRAIDVRKGMRVARGQAIGKMGTSGRSTSTHLHWEVWFKGKVVDPLPFLEYSDDVYALQDRSRDG